MSASHRHQDGPIGGRRHPLTGLAILADLLRELGVDPEPILNSENVDPVRLLNAHGEIDAATELRLIKRAIAVAGVPDLGLRAGCRHRFGHFGMWGLAIASSPDLESAIRLGLRHIALVHTFLNWRFVPDPEIPRLEATETFALGPARLFLFERDIAGCATLLGDLAGDRLAFAWARFPYPEPHWSGAYERALGTRIEFGGSRAVIGLHRNRLERPLPRANPMAARLAEEQCRQYLADKGANAGITARLRQTLLAEPGVLPDLDAAAADCGISARTMRRRLAAEGTTYRRELDRIREELACRYLSDTGLAVTEIATRLGYQDISGFGHAFRRWTGTNPTRWRRSHRYPDPGAPGGAG